jgi:hypothetical protein
MHRRLIRTVVVPTAVLALVVAEAWAQDTSSPPSACECTEVRFAPIYFWAPINTTSASEGEDSPTVDVTEGNTGLNGAFAARLEIEPGRGILTMGELFASISQDSTTASGGDASLEFKFSLFELYGGYEVIDHLSVVGGIRYTSVRLGYSASAGPSIDQDEQLLDPVVGLFYRPRLSKHWTAAINADVGGFGVGFDVSTSVSAVFTWRSGTWFGADVGYRALHMKKSDESDSLETTFYGPVVGFEIFF